MIEADDIPFTRSEPGWFVKAEFPRSTIYEGPFENEETAVLRMDILRKETPSATYTVKWHEYVEARNIGDAE